MFLQENSPLERPACYYVTMNVVDWIDIFVRPVFKQIIVESLNHFIEKKGLTVHAWCLMTNHLHLMAQAKQGGSFSLLADEFKKFTTKIILEDIDAEPEKRRDWIMQKFKEASRSMKLLNRFQVWQAPTSPVYINLQDEEMFNEQVEHIHNNPVRDKIVLHAEDYLYSSARDYIGLKGLVNVSIVGERPESISIIRHMTSYRH